MLCVFIHLIQISSDNMTGSERIFTYRGPADIPAQVKIGSYTHDFTPVLTHPRMRRLRGIGQLTPIEAIYPGATHTRHEHTLGVFGMGQDIIRERGNSDGPRIRMTEYQKFLFLLTLLVHDAGHYAYSHVGEIVSQAYGGPDHKRYCYEHAIPQMADAIREAAYPQFKGIDVVEALIEEIKHRGPLYRLATDKDRLDKWDYTVRDNHHCQLGSRPDIETLINALDFDGEDGDGKSALHFSARDALRSFLDTLTANNTSIYIHPLVEAYEGILIRAIATAVDNGMNLMAGFSMTDGDLRRELMRYPESREFMKALDSSSFTWRRDYVQAAALKAEGNRKMEGDGTAVEELTEDELDRFSGNLDLHKVRKLEGDILQDTGMEPHELVITHSPQIGRISFDENSGLLYWKDGGRKIYRSVFDVSDGFHDYLLSRLREQHGIRMWTRAEKGTTIQEFLRGTTFRELIKKAAESE